MGKKLFAEILAGLVGILICQLVMAADSVTASFNISGTVPTVFSVTTRGMPGDLDLSPNVVVNNRRLGLMHFKYNVNIASLVISSNTASGAPESSSGTYNFQGGGFKVAVDAGCATVDPTYNVPFTLTNAGTDVKSAASSALSFGVEEDCELLASWTGTNNALPLAGVYSLIINVTMTSM